MGFFDKIKKIGIFNGFSQLTDDFYDELEESLVMADLGAETTLEAVEELKSRCKAEKIKDIEGARQCMRDILAEYLTTGDLSVDMVNTPAVVLFIGVNGVGKTTSIGKLAARWKREGKKVLLCAGDTFRAAAADQLEIWAGRSRCEIVRQKEGADPGAVLFDALQAAKAAGIAVSTWDSDSKPGDRALMVSQGTPEVLGQMLVDLSVEGLKARGVDPDKDPVKYCWHYSQATVTDQNSWQVEGEKIIKEKYPNWENVQPDNYYSEQDAEKSVTIGKAVLAAHADIDLIICNDSTALPGQLEAAQQAGLTKDDVTITGFATPNAIKPYCTANILHNWGLWDCKVQGALGCYVAAYIAAGNDVKVGDTIDVPGIGAVEVMPNNCLNPDDTTADTNNGVVLLPERAIFNAETMNNYDF